MGTTKVRTVKAPSLKANIIDDVKEQIKGYVEQDVSDMRRELFDHDEYILRRVEKLEDKNFKRETSKLSLTDWCMIICYAAIFVGAIVVTIRTLKKTSSYGHS